MRLLSSRAARVSGPSGSLCALLALLLLTPPGPLASAGPVAAVVRELRCVCLTTTPGIHPKTVSDLQVIAAGPQCSKVGSDSHLEEWKGSLSGPRSSFDQKDRSENIGQWKEQLKEKTMC